MELILQRTYFKEGTNGALFYNDRFLGFTIELPWLNNARTISCIPEGVYNLKPRFSEKFKHHLQLQNVKGRSLILLHPANDARKELEGCIAPVQHLSGLGKGISSKITLQKIVSICYQAFDRKEQVTLLIKS
ncbi:hypothetical protein BX611_0267 [Lutibacter oceani]|uniref:DUF5675 domain-containing protein n=1 Tax=Lutibacter oceani TaxID=1853311 RepID=A0A3D9RST2_9FLAO|nr:DUF5675 family protein [Lutibacter oceani]REE82990.1 hypothetical protein BX611_0267 [Lutibacter oceani]